MLISLLFGFGIFAADRVVKLWIVNNFALGEVRAFIPGVLRLHYVQNTGMAFGFLAEHPWIFLVLTPLIFGVLGVLIAKNLFPCPVQRLAIVAVMAGGLGNWVDRLVYGAVIDMFEPTFMRFAVFNVADIFIVLGGIAFVIAFILDERRKEKAKVADE
ncbi:MAG: signal peptidase II [Oscillospiraceae bacterium]|nr:signal peptidase II [Oscillospiraceae bacterium]